MTGAAGLILDGVILVLLVATVFFAARLSLHLNQFRDNRRELETLLRTLSSQIDRAERVLENLKKVAHDSTRELQEQIDDAQSLGDELQIMMDSGGRLAARLEQAASGKAAAVHQQIAEKARRRAGEETSSREQAFPKSFTIRDPEFTPDDVAEEEQSFGSRAEQDLVEAIKARTRTSAGKV